MKRVFSYLSVLAVAGFVVVFSMLQSGCESAEGVDGLKIEPSNVSLSTNGQTVVLSVTGGITNEDMALPLEWRVSDSRVGRIIGSSGYSAIYQRTGGAGAVNTITAIDQYKNEGYATVRHEAASYGITLVADKSTISVGEAATITIDSTGSLAPYSWRKTSGPGSLSASSGSKSAVYSSDVAGTAVIQVTDANGASGTIGITVQREQDTGRDPDDAG